MNAGPRVGADLVVRSAARGTEHVERVALVKREDVRVGIAEMLREQERQQRRFAAAGRSDDQRMADVADVEVQTKRRCARGRRVRERRAVRRIERARLLRESRPDGRERQQIGEVERVQQRSADIRNAVAGQRPQERLDGVDVFDARTETGVMDRLEHVARRGIDELGVLIHQHDDARVVAELHRTARRIGQRGNGIGRHRVGVGIDVRRRGAGLLAHEVAQALALLPPARAVAVDPLLRGRRVKQNEAGRPPVAERQAVEEVEDARIALRRKAGDRDRANVAAADARAQAPEEVLRAKDRVEVHRNRRQVDRMVLAGETDHQVAEQLVVDVPAPEGILDPAAAQAHEPQRR